ncbi:MAG: YggS family pyridoxal phosphate enzyme [Bacteroidales bacterium]|nr:YggS family pyridoxal phosphate enzyme [Bacteroidales bacterium]
MIKQNLESILGKLPSGVQLVAVSKFHPVERLMEAYDAGQRIFGENRPQELAAKVPQMPSDVQWHFIGHLQTNKLKMVLPYASLVQSVDSFHLLEAINNWGTANNKVIDILLELHLGAEETKQGFSEEEIIAISRGVTSETLRGFAPSSLPPSFAPSGKQAFPPAQLPAGPSPLSPGVAKVSEATPLPMANIRIRGLMGMATHTENEALIEKDFERIETLYNKIKSTGLPGFDILSIGMSGDWPLAVKHGATMVRIGTDIFGPREY